MPTAKKSATARANGAKSHGPKTPATRAISSANALTHGLTSWNTLVLQNESQQEFDDLRAKYTAMFAPANDAETEFVNEMLAARWRLRRLWTIETALLDTEIDRQRPILAREFSRTDEGVHIALAFRALADDSRALHLASRYESRLRRIYDRAFDHLQTLQQARKSQEMENFKSNPPAAQPEQNEKPPSHPEAPLPTPVAAADRIPVTPVTPRNQYPLPPAMDGSATALYEIPPRPGSPE